MAHHATDLARQFAAGSLTPTEAVDEVLATIERLEPDLGAWQVVYGDAARRAAAAATEQQALGLRSGPFHGVPFALKDIVDVAGRVTTAGSAALIDRISPTTAIIARRLLDAGGVLIGKTKTVELALGGWGTNQHLGTPRNPWDADEHRAPGGSSSGSGVAVAAGMVPCAIGTDTGGSVRLPAALCGIVGLKTTEGLLPTEGIVPLSHTLDTPGPMARSVADAALMFEVLAGRRPADIDADFSARTGLHRPAPDHLRGVTLGSLGDGDRALVEADVLPQYDLALEQLAALGAEIRPVAMPMSFDELAELTFVIVTAEAWHHHGSLFNNDRVELDEHVRRRGLPGRDVSAQAYIEAQQTRVELRHRLLAAIDGIDAVVTPTTPATSPAVADLDEGTTPALFTRTANLLALSALTVPGGLTGERLPTAVQFMGRGHDEARLLHIGAGFEAARGPLPPPPLH
ncbi:MAG: amidase [Actinomycetota bacterium]